MVATYTTCFFGRFFCSKKESKKRKKGQKKPGDFREVFKKSFYLGFGFVQSLILRALVSANLKLGVWLLDVVNEGLRTPNLSPTHWDKSPFLKEVVSTNGTTLIRK